MAGRGCVISIQLLGDQNNEELNLPVALHSPLSVLKEQLEELTGIATRDQVLILCDLTDVERNNDVLLEGRDYMALRDMNIKNGSVLTLHALGMSAELKQKMMMEALKKKAALHDEDLKNVVVKEEFKKRTLATKITAAAANHSYNGVIFDVACNGPYELDLLSLSIGGMLGRVRVYARDRPWEANKPTQSSSPHWWAHREGICEVGWTLVADVVCRPSWDKPIEVMFSQPVKLLPHSRRGLYCHSGLPDDLGIQYQSYPSKDAIVAKDDYITLLPGLGHTGSTPFDDSNGWFRSWRGLAGSVSYRAKWKAWSPSEHRLFPADLKDAVRTMLLCQHREDDAATGALARACKGAGSSSAWSASSSSSAATSATLREGGADANADAGQLVDSDNDCGGYGDFDMGKPAAKVISSPESLKLCKLPKYVVYNIMEYLHWDWFEEVEKQKLSRKLKIAAAAAELAQRASAGRAAPSSLSARRQDFHRSLLGMAQALASGQQGIEHDGDDDDDEDEDQVDGAYDHVTAGQMLAALIAAHNENGADMLDVQQHFNEDDENDEDEDSEYETMDGEDEDDEDYDEDDEDDEHDAVDGGDADDADDDAGIPDNVEDQDGSADDADADDGALDEDESI